MIFAAISILSFFILSTGGLIVYSRRPKHLQIDYKHINELEFDLGLGHSNFGDKGIAIEAHAESVADETDRVIEQIDRKLNPEKWKQKDFEKKVISPFRVPTHMMGESHPPTWRSSMKRFEFPPGDTTYTGPHGLSCPCADCYGEIQKRAYLLDDTNTLYGGADLVRDLRKTARVGGRPLEDPLAVSTLTDKQRAKMSTYIALKNQGLPVPPDLERDVLAI